MISVISTTSNGQKGNESSDAPVYSQDGSKIIFDSTATNLVAGTPANSENFFAKDLTTGAITKIFTVPDAGNSLFPVVSSDDTSLTFQSTDSLVPAANNGNDQVFVEDAAGNYTLASSTVDGTQGNGGNFSPTFSKDGTMVVFQSNSTNFGGNPNSLLELFVKNRTTGQVQLVSSSASGAPANQSDQLLPAYFSADGTKVAFSSPATNLVAGTTGGQGNQLYVKNLVSGSETLVSSAADGTESNAGGAAPTFSPDGTEVAFTSESTNLSPQATSGAVEIYVKNLTSGAVTLVSSAADGTASNGGIDFTVPPVFSPDGSEIAFASSASNLTPAGTNGSASQIYVKNLTTGAIKLVSVGTDGLPGNNSSSNPAFSPDGSQLTFQSNATNLVQSNDNTTATQIFVADLVTCFATDTAIRCARGDMQIEVAVQDLAVGDVVVTASGARRPICWLGHRTIDCRNHPRPQEALPIRISAHALGTNRPARDLFVSPGHSICVDIVGEVLIPAIALVNGSTIQQVDADEVIYFHVELESHDILLAENLPAESYLDMGNRSFFAEADVVDLEASPDADPAQRTHADFCRPFVDGGPVLDAVKMQLRRRAESHGWVRNDALELHLVVDGKRFEPVVRGLTARFEMPADAKDVWLEAPTARPCDVMGSGDSRDLGLFISALRIDDGFELRDIAMNDPLLCIGFHAVEDGPRRWTSGRARLPAALWKGCENGFYLRVELAGMPLPRWLAPAAEAVAAERPTLSIVA